MVLWGFKFFLFLKEHTNLIKLPTAATHTSECPFTSACLPQFNSFVSWTSQHQSLFRQYFHCPYCSCMTLQKNPTSWNLWESKSEHLFYIHGEELHTCNVIIHRSFNQTLAVVSHDPLNNVPNFPDERLQTGMNNQISTGKFPVLPPISYRQFKDISLRRFIRV